MDETTSAVAIVLLLLLVNIVWAIGLFSDYRANRFGWMIFGILVPVIGIARGIIAMMRSRRTR